MIQIPADASRNVQRAFQEIDERLKALDIAVTNARNEVSQVTRDTTKQLQKEMVYEARKAAAWDPFFDLFRGGGAHAMGAVPDPGYRDTTADLVLSPDGAWRHPVVETVPYNKAGTSIAQRVVNIHGSLAVQSALSAYSLLTRDIVAYNGLTVGGNASIAGTLTVAGVTGPYVLKSGDTMTGQLTVTGATDSTATTTGDIWVASANSNTPNNIVIVNTNADSNAGGLRFIKNGTSPADGDWLGTVRFSGYNDGGGGGTLINFARITGYSTDVSAGTEDGQIVLGVVANGSMTAQLTLTPSLAAFVGAVTVATTLEVTGIPTLSQLINGATEETNAPDQDADYLLLYDASTSVNKKLLPQYLSGAQVQTTLYGGSPGNGNRNDSTDETSMTSHDLVVAAAQLEVGDTVQVDMTIALAANGNTKTVKFYANGTALTVYTGTGNDLILHTRLRVVVRSLTSLAFEGFSTLAANAGTATVINHNLGVTVDTMASNTMTLLPTLQGGATGDLILADATYTVFRACGSYSTV